MGWWAEIRLVVHHNTNSKGLHSPVWCNEPSYGINLYRPWWCLYQAGSYYASFNVILCYISPHSGKLGCATSKYIEIVFSNPAWCLPSSSALVEAWWSRVATSHFKCCRALEVDCELPNRPPKWAGICQWWKTICRSCTHMFPKMYTNKNEQW